MIIRHYQYTGEIPNLTHKQIVDRVFLWLRSSNKHSVVFRERVTSVGEVPDVIGFKTGGFSTIVECKTSRSDYFADAKKLFRKYPQEGMGLHRYYAAPVGMLKPEDLPPKWGLIEVYEKENKRANMRIRIPVKAEPFPERALLKECSYLISAIRRIEISMAVFVEGK